VTQHPALTALGLAAPVGYALANAAASVLSSQTPTRLRAAAALRLPAVYATMHGAWGLGFLRGLPADERGDAAGG
jgi:hypothetical protein